MKKLTLMLLGVTCLLTACGGNETKEAAAPKKEEVVKIGANIISFVICVIIIRVIQSLTKISYTYDYVRD